MESTSKAIPFSLPETCLINSHIHHKFSPTTEDALCAPLVCPLVNSRPRRTPEVHQLLPHSWLSVFGHEWIEQSNTAASDISVLWKPASQQGDHFKRCRLSSRLLHRVGYQGNWCERERGLA